jgi:hypothetical protein
MLQVPRAYTALLAPQEDENDIDTVLESIKAPRFIDFLSEGAQDGEANLAWRLSIGENPVPQNAPQPGGGFQDDDDFGKALRLALPCSSFLWPPPAKRRLCSCASSPRTHAHDIAERMDALEMQLELGGDHLVDASATWNNLSCANTSTEVSCSAGAWRDASWSQF